MSSQHLQCLCWSFLKKKKKINPSHPHQINQAIALGGVTTSSASTSVLVDEKFLFCSLCHYSNEGKVKIFLWFLDEYFDSKYG